MQVLDQQLGTGWRDRFSSFDDEAAASASIGQVHRGVWSDGREVAVKIQYPGADEALRADLKTIRRLTGIFKQLAPGVDVKGVIDELIERTEMELDYRLEADNQRIFAKAYAGGEGMKHYTEMVQEPEFAAREKGYTFVSHQQEVGAGYFDDVTTVIQGGSSSVKALTGSTEEEQFH